MYLRSGSKIRRDVVLRAVALCLAILLCAESSLLRATPPDPSATLAPRSGFEGKPPKIKVRESPYVSAGAAAREVVDEIIANNRAGRPTVMVLFTGNTARLFYRQFADLVKSEGVDLSRMATFNLGEYDILPGHPASSRSFMEDALFSHVNIRPENIHFLSYYDAKGRRLEPDALRRHMEEYEQKLKAYGGADIVLLGVGPNGRVGLSQPGPDSTADSRTREVALTPETREANKDAFNDNPNLVPPKALSMGIGTILEGKKILLMAFGEGKREAVHKMLHGEIGSDVPASFLRRHPNVTVYCDTKALTPRPFKQGLLWAYDKLIYGISYIPSGVNKLYFYSVGLAFLAAALAGTAFNVFGLGPIAGLIISLGVIVYLLVDRSFLDKRNPFRTLTPGGTRESDGVVYGLVQDVLGENYHFAQPKQQNNPSKPVIFFAHGRELELLTGFFSKVRSFLDIFARFPYDVRSYWGNVKNPELSFLSRIAKGYYLRKGKTLQDNAAIVSTDYAKIGQWPFYNLTRLKSLGEGALGKIFGVIRDKTLIPQPTPDKSVLIGFSTGARLGFIQAIREHLLKDEKTGFRSLNADFDPKIRGMVMINAFFHTGKIANWWMWLQRVLFWDPLAKAMRIERSAYQEMDRSSDLTKIFTRARLAAEHKDWPQTVWISTQSDDERLAPIPWRQYRERVRRARRWGLVAAAAGIGWDLAKKSVAKISLAFLSLFRGHVPWYQWVGSFFVDFRGSDGIVDPSHALGKDYYGRPLDPRALAIIVKGIGHDCIDHPLIQKLSFQLADLIADGVDLRRVELMVTSQVVLPDGQRRSEVAPISLADYSSTNPLILNANEIQDIELAPLQPAPARDVSFDELLGAQFLIKSPLTTPGKEWNAKTTEALPFLEQAKGLMTQKAWAAAVTAKSAFDFPPEQEEDRAREVIRERLQADWISATVLMEAWIANGLVDLDGWKGQDAEFLARIRRLSDNRSRTIRLNNRFSVDELGGFQLADWKFYRQLEELLPRIRRPLEFNDALRKLHGKEGELWKDFSQQPSAMQWIRLREEHFVQWITQSKLAVARIFSLLDILGDKELLELWEEYDKKMKSASQLYQEMTDDRSGKLLRLLLMLDLRVRVGVGAGTERKGDSLGLTSVDAAA